ncbi:MAG: universal stress protein [Pseudolabrys sp.]|nr:universal stress protein [Pseudolabrys sp.]
MIKDMIVNLGLAERDPTVDYAVSMAEAFAAHILGVAFAYEPVIPGTVMGGMPPEVIDAQRNEANQKARAALARFEQAAKRAGVMFETHLAEASIAGGADRFSRLARRFDIAVVGQPRRGETAAEEVLSEAVLFDSGRPVVFVPFIQRGGFKPDRTMIAWDGSRAATRAVADSLPLLQKAKTVEIVIVASKPEKDDEVPGADLAQHLARHGLAVEVKRITSPDVDVASTLLSYAADAGVDMIVMGGYGHSRLREFVLGGVTRGLLESMTVPVLMSH